MADPKHPRKFGEEFERQVVEMHDNGKPTSETLEEHDLGSPTFHRRVRAIHGNGSAGASDNRTLGEQELVELRGENRQLGMENDISRQAAPIHARRQPR